MASTTKGKVAIASDAKMPTEGLSRILETIGRPLVNLATIVIPLVIVFVSKIRALLSRLPQNALYFLYGTIICFFGGTFPTLFAALKAAEFGGRKSVAEALTALSEEALVIIEASKKDDVADEDNDGKIDIKQVNGQEILQRKTLLVLKKMNPQRVNDSLGAIYKVWLAVAAVLSIQFARTVSLSLTIANFLEMPCQRFIAPAARLAVPKDFHKWVPVVLCWVCKWIALSLAWTIQSAISAAASALDGGLMMARALYAFCLAHRVRLGGFIPEKHEDTYIDEIFAYTFAALGFYFQFKSGFNLPFPLNLILWPFDIAEFYIRWSITK
ncbi:hypothetical protein MPSEU_000474600 [Mayamaea pseudoterrestris]|nr:hypothetical protein MPSEU_000474600 [Mayamaea pseudoterrestris]